MQYDVIIIGDDFISLSIALFLARKMRNIMLIPSENSDVNDASVISITDPENKKYHFHYQRMNKINGIGENTLFSKYLTSIGLAKNIKTTEYIGDIIVEPDNSLHHRFLSFEQFRTYLVRYYPKQRNQIYHFFSDLHRHYENFTVQYKAMLSNNEYTLTSLMIEWGDFSLYDLFKKYFRDPNIIEEFTLNSDIGGLDPEKINSYNYFMNLFLGLIDSTQYLNTSLSEIKKKMMANLNAISPKIIQKDIRIKEFVQDENNRLKSAIDIKGNEYKAKYFILNDFPQSFVKKFYPAHPEKITDLLKYYPNTDTDQLINTMYIASNQTDLFYGMKELDYYFKEDKSNGFHLIRLFNYKKFDNKASDDKSSAFCVDFTYHKDDNVTSDMILNRIYQLFPKLKKTIVGIKLGTPTPHFSMLSNEEVRKGLSINDKIAIESGEKAQPFDNLYLVGEWLRPEASLFGLFHSGIVLADKIEEKLYYGEDDDSFYYLTNDEIMMMMRHNYKPTEYNNSERYINFVIGKNEYYIRTKKGNIAIHRGQFQNPDFSIISTNDKLSNLLLKKSSLEDVLHTGGFRYLGNSSDFYPVINMFQLDDYQEYEHNAVIKNKIKNQGLLFMYMYIMIFSLSSFLIHLFDVLWVFPFALVASAVIGYFKFTIYRKILWSEICFFSIYVVGIVLNLIFPNMPLFAQDTPYLLFIGIVFFISWVINRPIVFDFHHFDYQEDYAGTKLFNAITNGLTFLWSLIFFGIPLMIYISGIRYLSVIYFLVFLGFFLGYYYPMIYVKANIKK